MIMSWWKGISGALGTQLKDLGELPGGGDIWFGSSTGAQPTNKSVVNIPSQQREWRHERVCDGGKTTLARVAGIEEQGRGRGRG